MKCNEIISLKKSVAKGEIRESLCNGIFKEIDERGLGTLSKTDLETLIFHSIVDSLEDYDEYELMRIFKVSPTKLRSLRLNESVKFYSLDLEERRNLIKILTVFNSAKFETISSEKDKVRFYIGDVHSYRLMEKFLRVKTNSSPDYQLNPHQMDVKYSCLQEIVNELVKSIKHFLPGKSLDLDEKINGDLQKDRSYTELQLAKMSLAESLKSIKEKGIEKGVEVFFEKAFNTLLVVIKHRLCGGE